MSSLYLPLLFRGNRFPGPRTEGTFEAWLPSVGSLCQLYPPTWIASEWQCPFVGFRRKCEMRRDALARISMQSIPSFAVYRLSLLPQSLLAALLGAAENEIWFGCFEIEKRIHRLAPLAALWGVSDWSCAIVALQPD
jgi:hypothetical protein